MCTYELVVSGVVALALFAYGQSLSREIEETGGTKLKAMLSRVTEIRRARLSPRNPHPKSSQ